MDTQIVDGCVVAFLCSRHPDHLFYTCCNFKELHNKKSTCRVLFLTSDYFLNKLLHYIMFSSAG